jgi:hypothetical protein
MERIVCKPQLPLSAYFNKIYNGLAVIGPQQVLMFVNTQGLGKIYYLTTNYCERKAMKVI